jgi:hypothetical protein
MYYSDQQIARMRAEYQTVSGKLNHLVESRHNGHRGSGGQPDPDANDPKRTLAARRHVPALKSSHFQCASLSRYDALSRAEGRQ